MSASASKKRRQLLNEHGLNPKQAAAEAKKKEKFKKMLPGIIFAGAFVVAIGLILALVFLGKARKERIMDEEYADHIGASTTVLASVGDVDFTAAMYNYYYSNNTSNSDGDVSLETLNHNLGETLNLYDAAVKAGYELPEEKEDAIDDIIDDWRETSETYNYPKLDYFLRDNFGEGCNEDNFREYLTIIYTAESYTEYLKENYDPGAEALAAEYEEHADEYDVIVYDVHTVTVPEAAAAAESTDETADAEADAEAAEDTADTEEAESADDTDAASEGDETELIALAEEAKASFPEDAEKTVKNTTITPAKAESTYSDEVAAWLRDSSRKDGDVEYFKVTSDETSTYYVFRFHEYCDNSYTPVVADVAYFYNYSTTTDSADASDAASEGDIAEDADASKAPAELLAELVQQATADMTDEEYEELLNSTSLYFAGHSSSEYAKYGGYEQIATYLYSKDRQPGDTQYFELASGIIYAVVRYQSAGESSYRDVIARGLLVNDKIEELQHANELVINEDAYALTKVDTSLYLP